MPRIRKKTSNRVKINDRQKLKKRIKDSKRKKAKEAKKNPQWKSRKPKDPGIPNEFPYKDQILAEVAEQRRLAAEEKQRKKDEKKALRTADTQPVDAASGSESEGEAEPEAEVEDLTPKGLNVGADAIASLSAKLVRADLKQRPKRTTTEDEEEEEEEEVPVLINRDLQNLKAVFDKADVVIHVLDARDPLPFRSQFLEELVGGMKKKVVFVLNKIDTIPRESLTAWLTYLRMHIPTSPVFLFRSATAFLPAQPDSAPISVATKKKGKSKVPTNDAVGTEGILACLAKYAKEKKGRKKKAEELNVAVVGVANAGKSSLINSLLNQALLEIYNPVLGSSARGPTTTTLPQEAVLSTGSGDVRFIDTPGLAWVYEDEEQEEEEEEEEGDEGDEAEEEERKKKRDAVRARDILVRSRGRIDRLKDPLPPVEHILARSNVEDLMLLYSLPAFAKGETEAFLVSVARAQQLVKKKGRLDTAGAAKNILRDWSTGEFARYTMPPSTPSPPSAPAASSKTRSGASPAKKGVKEEWYAGDEKVISALPLRKEMRKAGVGLVRLSPEKVEVRKVDVEVLFEEEESEEEGEEDEEGMDVDEEDAEGSEEEDVEEDDDDDEEEEEEEAPPPPSLNKQKRKRGTEATAAAPPSKKVAFAAQAKGPANAPLPSASAKSPASVLKKPAAKKAAKAVNEKVPKVANKAGAKKAGATPGEKEGEAYDFGKFF